MKKQIAATQENRRDLRHRLVAALALLMVAVILAVGTTYMWLTLSVRPEVSGIVTHIGANGSLEIALLNEDTYKDPNSIKTPGIGESLAAGSPEANERWGNLLNLEDESYGLSNIMLYPSRLNAVLSPDGKSYQIGDKMLSVPSYGYDGRIVALKDNTMAGKYNGTGFVYNPDTIGYGVRAIGSTETISVQSSYLAEAKSKISGYNKSAQSSAVGSLSGLKDLITKIAVSETFNNSDVASLKTMINGLKASEDYIEGSLRQGLVAIMAAALEDESAFNSLREVVMNENKTISQILSELNVGMPIPSDFTAWVAAQEQMQSDLNAAMAACDAMTDNDHSKAEFRVAMDYIMKLEKVYLGDNKTGKPILQANKTEFLNTPLTVTLAPGSGVYAIIADFTGNYTADVGTIAKVKTASSEMMAYLSMLSMVVNDLTPAGGGAVSGPVTLKDTYGYVLDMAFRCNAHGSDLLLQTDASQRVYEDSNSAATMGGGSYMEFTTTGSNTMQIVTLMDSVRVAFIDNQGNILGIAKLNTSNYEASSDGFVRAPLYLYEFTIVPSGQDKGKLVMGERLKDTNFITSLDQNIAKAITTLVWMDGDMVDNTMVSNESQLSGMLNLQFASSVDLIPLDDSGLMNYAVDKAALTQTLQASQPTYDAGQGYYTTESWNAYAAAYQYAEAINIDLASKPLQVDRAGKNLKKAEEGLQVVDLQSLQTKISAVRDMVGTTNVVGAYLSKDNEPVMLEDGDTTVPADAKRKVYRVDYNYNLHDEGNGFVTRIYDDESWTALAKALYNAECIDGTNPSRDVIDQTISGLDAAVKALDRGVYYLPYDYEGTLYYMGISEEQDTYGKWYDTDFHRIVSDLATINLDAYATPVTIVNISGDYLISDTTATSLSMNLISDVYAVLNEQIIVANNWVLPDGFSFAGGFNGGMKDPAPTITVVGDIFNVNELYAVPYEMLNLRLNGVADGNHSIKGTLLTDAGVLINCDKVLNVYTKSTGVKIDDNSFAVTADSTGELTASLIGGSETITSYRWYLESGSATTISINEYNGSWSALKSGAVTVRVQVETAQGNKYTSAPITITVE